MEFLLVFLFLMLIACDFIVRSLKFPGLSYAISPSLWFTAPWIISALLLVLPIFEHREALTIQHVSYIFLCHVSLAVGGWLSKGESNPARNFNVPPLSDSKMVAVAIVGIVGHIASAVDSVQTTGIGILERLSPDGLARARAGNFLTQAGAFESGFIGKFSTLIAFSYIFVACFLMLKSIGVAPSRRLRIWLWVCIFAIGVNSLVINVGRIQLVLLALITLALFVVSKGVLDVTKVRFDFGKLIGRIGLFFFVGCAAISLGSLFGQLRGGGLANPDELLYASHRIKLTELANDVTHANEDLRFGLFTLSYFTVPVPTLSVYLDMPTHNFPGPAFGQYNFPPIAGRIAKWSGSDGYAPWLSLREDVFSGLARLGYSTNVWSTMIRDVAIDVSWVGAPFIFMLLGWITSSLAVRAAVDRHPYTATLASTLLVVCGFSIFHSLLYIESISGLILMATIAIAVEAINKRLSSF